MRNPSNTDAHGTFNHMNSLRRTSIPRALRKPARPIGDTSIGCHGAKYRLSSNGIRKPTPKPPFVNASMTQWDAVATKPSTASRATSHKFHAL